MGLTPNQCLIGLFIGFINVCSLLFKEMTMSTITINNIMVDIRIYTEEEKPVPEYNASITNISDATKIILEKIRQEFISKMSLEDIAAFIPLLLVGAQAVNTWMGIGIV